MKRTPLLAFCACLGLAVCTRAQDILGLQVQRDEFFTQCISNGPAPDTARGHALGAWVIGSSGESVISGTVSTRDQTWSMTNSGEGLFLGDELTNAAPGGPYTFTIRTAFQGIRTHTVSLPAMSKKLAPPKVRTFEAAQSVNAAEAFTVEWEPLKGAGTRDKLWVRISDEESDRLVDVELGIGQTSFTIPAGTLRANSTNDAYIHFAHLISAKPPGNGKPYVITVETRTTHFPLITRNPAGAIEFASNKLAADEASGSIAIPLQRTAGEGVVTVDYSVEPLTAQPGVNYQPASGTATFAAGSTNAQISVALLNDGAASAPLLARLWLTNATGGATLPRRSWINWTILDSQTAPGKNLDAVVLVKAAFHRQTNEDPATASLVCAPNRFYASVQPSFPGGVTSATLRAGRMARTIPEAYKWLVEYNEDFPTRTAMDKAFRSGAYTITVNTLDGATIPLDMRLGREPLFPAPRLSNWTEAQTIDATAAFQLEWDPFPGATTNDAVSVIIRDLDDKVVFETPEILEPGLLPGHATSMELPPNLLSPGQKYRVVILFAKVPRIDIDPATGARTCAAFLHATGTEINTAGADGAMAAPARSCCGASARSMPAERFPFKFR